MKRKSNEEKREARKVKQMHFANEKKLLDQMLAAG